jgi:hypothetical protein
MATEVPDARLTQTESADANVFIDTNTTDLTTILGEFATYYKSNSDLIPDADGIRDLGATATRFAETYTDALDVTNNIVVGGTVDGRDVATDGTKLDGVEALADVTDTANVTAAGALMDSEVDADIKTLTLPASTTISTFGASLVDDASAAAARTTLGVDPAGTDNHTPVYPPQDLLGNFMLTTDGEGFVEPYTILATNDLFGHPVLRLGSDNTSAPSTKHGISGAITIPDYYASSGTAKIIIQWTSTLTTGNVVFDFEYRSVGGNDTESLDQATYQESLSVTDAAPGAAHRRMTAELTITAANLTAGDTLTYFLYRDGTDAADTLAGSALIHAATFQFTP